MYATDSAKDLGAAEASAPEVGRWLVRYSGTPGIVSMAMLG